MALVKLDFAPPQAGWLPTRLVVGDQTLEFTVSRVPNNAIEELFDAVASAAAGRDGTAWWAEEPGGYQLQLTALDDGQIRMQLRLFRHLGDKPGREIADVRGSRLDILLPLWRGLRQFTTFDLGSSAWTAPLRADFAAMVLNLREVIGP